ncbi:hypothetical protein ACW7GZ_14875 [Luteimonas sp. A537]
MLKSALSIEGLLAIIDQQGEAKKQQYTAAGYAQYNGQSMYVAQFEGLKRSGALPPDASFAPQTTHDGMARSVDYSKPGFVTVPDARGIDSDTRSLKDEVHDKLQANGGTHAHTRFLDTFKAKTEDDSRKLARVELDYKVLFDSAARKLVTGHDFDEDYIFDGVFYLVCVCKLTYAGYLTDNGLDWYQKFLTDNPNDKENLLLRALLGNQKSAFAEWVAKGSGPYGRLRSIVSQLDKLKPEELGAEGRAMLRYLPYFKLVLAGYASPVLTVMGAVATGLSKRQQISVAFRQKLAALAGLLGGHASGANPPALLKLSLPMPDAARIWRQQVGAIQNAVRKFAGTVKGERVQSLVLEGAIALETRGAQQAGDILVDVYLWVDDLPDAVGDAFEGEGFSRSNFGGGGAAVAARLNGYVLRPAAANLYGRAVRRGLNSDLAPVSRTPV